MERRRLGPGRATKPPSNAAEDKALAVETDGDAAAGEHALEHAWAFWGRGQRPSERGAVAWESEKLHEVTTVEAWWRLEKALQAPSGLAAGANYQLFRGGTAPTWEDPANARGGEWTLNLPSRCAALDGYWGALCLGCIGGELAGDAGDGSEVVGVSLSVRKGGVLRLNVWTKTKADGEAQKAIGARIRESLALPEDIKLTYTAHDTSDTIYEC